MIIFVSFFYFVLGSIVWYSEKDFEYCCIAIAACTLALLLCKLKDFKKALYKHEDEIEELKKKILEMDMDATEYRIRVRKLERRNDEREKDG